MLTLFRVFSLLFVTIIPSLTGLPQQAQEQDGPCTGMDCLHGVLMHNDEEQGEKHKAEDQYLRFKETLDTGDRPEFGTKNAEDQLHNMLMHNGEEVHHKDVADILPETRVERGPQDPNEFLHEGMHGEEGSHKHAWDDDVEDIPVLHEPGNGDKLMHDVLMHGGEAHDHEAEEKDDDVEDVLVLHEPGNGDKLMHDVLMHGGEAHNHEAEEKADKAEDVPVLHEPGNGDKLMHDILMHGGESHDHETEGKADTEKDENVRSGPEFGEELMHGILMHGDRDHKHESESESDSESADSESVGIQSGPRGEDLHGILMHGDAEHGKDHSHEHEADKSEPFSDILEILNMDFDESLLKVIDIEKLIKKDMDEYKEWIKNNPQYQDDTLLGSTNLEVTDSILNDIELMKNRYLRTPSEFPDVPPKPDEFPFTADDAKDILNGAEEKDDDEDLRHYLELAGSTEPLNSRHKVKLDLIKAKLNDEH